MSQVAHPSREHNKIHNHLVARKKPVKTCALSPEEIYCEATEGGSRNKNPY